MTEKIIMNKQLKQAIASVGVLGLCYLAGYAIGYIGYDLIKKIK